MPFNKIDAVTNVAVIDAATDEHLAFSSSRLDKTNPSSWNKYTTWSSGGEEHIEWYYNLAQSSDQTRHTWILSYKVHGALAFYKDHDELYWNLFTNYSVPVDHVTAEITLPGNVTAPQSSFYTTANHQYQSSHTGRQFTFSVDTIAPEESVTFAVGWQKGLIDQLAYWQDWLRFNWEFPAGFIIVFVASFFCLAYILYERSKYAGRGTIVPEYEPPKHLPPAMAEVIAKGHLSTKAWPATVVDLAVRGYLTVEEKKRTTLIIFPVRDYILHRTVKNAGDLKPYEETFLHNIFVDSDELSLVDLRRSSTKSQSLYIVMQKLQGELYEETQADTHAFVENPAIQWRVQKWFVLALGAAVLLAYYMFDVGSGSITFPSFFFLIALAVSVFIVWFAVFIRRQLNR